MGKVCAIVPTYNRPHLVVQAIDSLLAQSIPPNRIVVADDGSESTRSALACYGDRIEHRWAPNSGKSAALNRVLAEIGDELVWIFDDDDLAHPTALERMVEALKSDSNAAFVYGRYDYLVERNGEWSRVKPTVPWTTIPNLKLAILERCFLFQPGMLVRRSAYRMVGPFDETLLRSQDYDMLLRLSRRFTGVEADGILFHQRQHGGDRGPSHARSTAATRQLVWAATDGRIFERIADTYALGEFLGKNMQDAHLNEADRGQALLNRAAILARKGLWERAAADMDELTQLVGGDAVRTERLDYGLLLRLYRSQSYALGDPGRVVPFRDALHRMPQGRLISRRVARPLFSWFRSALKRRDLRRALEVGIAILQFTRPIWRMSQGGRR